jgi:broad specificity phosphatase PhoE
MTQEQPRRPAVFDEAFLTDVPDVSEVLLIRHGQQIEPAPGMSAGELVDPPLSERGLQQAELVGRALSTTKIEAVYASPLSRASETAAAIARHQQLDVTTIPDLHEIKVFRDVPGDRNVLEFIGADVLKATRQRMLNEKVWDVYPYSESSAEFRKRVVNSVEAIIARHTGQRVAVVCHGGVINIYLAHIIGTPYDMFFRPAHTSINVVLAGRSRRVFRSLNDVHHLMTPEGDFHTY